jgi:ATP-dependent Clp endopeptidase proteolytic subunit ClpP
MTPDNTQRLESTLHASIDWKARIVYISGPVEDCRVEALLPAIRMLDETKGKIRVFIMSPGGSEIGGYAIYDTLTTLNNRVDTYAFGCCFSIAPIILQAGHKRWISPNTQVMIHNGSISFDNGDVKLEDIAKLSKECDVSNLHYATLLASKSKVNVKEVALWCKNETYFTPDEVVKYGLADSIIKSAKDLL